MARCASKRVSGGSFFVVDWVALAVLDLAHSQSVCVVKSSSMRVRVSPCSTSRRIHDGCEFRRRETVAGAVLGGLDLAHSQAVCVVPLGVNISPLGV